MTMMPPVHLDMTLQVIAENAQRPRHFLRKIRNDPQEHIGYQVLPAKSKNSRYVLHIPPGDRIESKPQEIPYSPLFHPTDGISDRQAARDTLHQAIYLAGGSARLLHSPKIKLEMTGAPSPLIHITLLPHHDLIDEKA